MLTKALVSVVAVSAAVVPVANAHTLSKTTAKAEARKAGVAIVKELGGSPFYNCTRRGEHRVDCQVSLVTLDGSACVAVIRVAYRSHRDRTLSRKVLNGPDCSPPEIPFP